MTRKIPKSWKKAKILEGIIKEKEMKLKIENNKVICSCGKDLGKFEQDKVFFCKKCFVSGFCPVSYGINALIEVCFEFKDQEIESYKKNKRSE
ncbi:hypothetical protein ES704_01493 [subsurface metagenome]|jgi:hypothetical protein